MQKKYLDIEEKLSQLEADLQNPAVLNDPKKIKDISQEYTELKPTVEKIRELARIEKAVLETQTIIDTETDAQIKEMAIAEIPALEQQKIALEKELDEMTRPQDPFDKKDVIMEIRAGVGGDESALFSAELYRMYNRYADSQGWKTQMLDANRIGIGGFKEVIFSIKGRNVYKDRKKWSINFIQLGKIISTAMRIPHRFNS
jgi:peptide chain release factor 1